MIVDKIGRYELEGRWSVRGGNWIEHHPAGEVIEITQIDRDGHKVTGPEIGDWVDWEIPAHLVKEEPK